MTTETIYKPIGLSGPIKFLGATVLSFNGNLGFGGQESTLTVELVEDCETTPPQVFADGNPDVLIGKARCFPDNALSSGMAFSFCGIITNWTKNDSSSGLTYSVTLTDPRRILENFSVIVDTYSGPLIQEGTPNVRNVYAEYINCDTFDGADRGMPYSVVIKQLGSIDAISPTGRATLSMDLTVLPSNLPPHYRVNGPAISVLQLITDVCEATGNDFYIYMPNATTIDIGLINLNRDPALVDDEFKWIRDYGLNNNPHGVRVIDRSYGREMRVEKQKTIIFGEKRHYLTMATDLKPFFGENNQCEAVTAMPGGACGFSVLVDTAPLAASLRSPGVFATAGNQTISEVDLRCNFDLWKERVLVGPEANLSEFDQTAKEWMINQQIEKSPRKTAGDMGISQEARDTSTADRNNNPQNADGKLAEERYNEDVKKIFGYIESLQQTYYGKQYLGKLQDVICYRRTGDIVSNASTSTGGCASSEMVYSAQPTNDGGWIDGGSVMGVSDPYLGFFKQEDGRVGSFALFSVAGDTPPSDGTGDGSDSGGGGGSPGDGSADSGGTGGK
jgi:hypothetical protein